jgi:hypothetical protein
LERHQDTAPEALERQASTASLRCPGPPLPAFSLGLLIIAADYPCAGAAPARCTDARYSAAMAISANTRKFLDALPDGAKVTVKLGDGSAIAGAFRGIDDAGEVLVDDGAGVATAHIALDMVENVLLDVSSDGPE